jgi:hypothetical protein
MKQWTKNDLILFYYDELGSKQRHALIEDMAKSEALQLEYATLNAFLDTSVDLEVPEPSSQLEHQIMASIFQQKQKQAEAATPLNPEKTTKSSLFSGWDWRYLLGKSVPVLLVIWGVFLLGRYSTNVDETSTTTLIAATDSTGFDALAGKRVFLNTISSHLGSTDRLLTQVSNSTENLPFEIENRRQAIEEMVALNRLYRRLAEKSGDKLLAGVLQQMEQILTELKHTQQLTPEVDSQQDWNNIRNRIDSTDLLFRLRVTKKSLNNQSI